MKGLRRSLFWLFGVTLVLTACASPQRIWLKAPGWYRAQLMANTSLVDPVTIALDDLGTTYLFLFAGDEDTSYHPRVMALNQRAEAVWDHTYTEIELSRPDQSRILWDGDRLQLYWISHGGLYNSQIEPASGSIVGSASLLSGDREVGSYDVAINPQRAITVWYGGTQKNPGVYALPTGDLTRQAVLIDDQGIRPDVQYDNTGRLHAIWTHYPPGTGQPQFLYAVYPDGEARPGRQETVIQPNLGTTTLFGPWLGLDEERAYLFWTVAFRMGSKAGNMMTYYVHFPQGRPASTSSVRYLAVPSGYHPEYQPPPEDGLQAGPRAPLGPTLYGSDFVVETSINPSTQQELVIAFRTQVAYQMRKEQSQVCTLFFKNGVATHYQLISFTPVSSGYPVIFSDSSGQLYLTWLEQGDTPGYQVYFASTAPDIRQALSRFTWNDAGQIGAETTFGLLSGVVLTPLALIWIIVPLISLLLTSFIRRGEDSLFNAGVLISLALALAAYWISKLAFFPGITDYVPFSAWMPFIPPWLNVPLQVVVPLVIAGLALFTAWRYTYGRDRPAALLFVLIYAVMDGVLTMGIYGTIFYGVS